MDPEHLLLGVSLSQLSPNLDFWSDASDVGWGAHLGPKVVSGLWSQEETSLSINARELLAVERGLLHFRSSINHSMVAVFSDNSAAVAYLRNAGGTQSPALNSIAQRILRWSELHHVAHSPGHCRLLACCHDSLFPAGFRMIDIVWLGPVLIVPGLLWRCRSTSGCCFASGLCPGRVQPWALVSLPQPDLDLTS